MGDPADTFGLFVSSVEGQPVHRFGSKVLIGADADPENPKKIRYRTGDIIAIPHAEALRHAREYGRLISDGALIERTADEWRSQQTQPVEGGERPRVKAKATNDGTTESGR
jgi:hypothetical protein